MADQGPAAESDVALTASDGAPLLARLRPASDPRGVVVIAHGFGEHGGRYAHVAEALARSPGLDVLSFDFRGHGRSGGRRGVVRRHSDLVLDLAAAVAWAGAERPALPRFLLGHSNGGLVSILGVLRGDLGLSGLILSNPSLRLIAEVPAWKLRAGRVLERVAPWVTLDAGLRELHLTADPAMLAALRADTLRHRRISPPLFFGMAAAGPVALARAGEARVPTLLILGGEDRVADPDAGRLFFEELGSADKTLSVHPGMRHEPLNDLGREAVIAEIAAWIEARLP